MRKLNLVLAAVMLIVVTSLSARDAAAVPSSFQFTVTAVEGPLEGVSSTGTFSFDPSIIPTTGEWLLVEELFTHLSFSWDGVHFDQTTANTGALGFEPDGTFIYALFGTDCVAGGCGVGTTEDPVQWSFDIYTIAGAGAFWYRSPRDPTTQYLGVVSVTPLATPTTKQQCMKGGWKSFQGPKGPFKNQGDCIQFVNTGK